MLAVLRLALALLITWVALLIARIALLTVLRLTLLITWVTLLIARIALVAVLRLTLLVARFTVRLLIARALAIAGRTLIARFTRFARRLVGTRSACGGSAVFSAIVAFCTVITLGIVALVFTGNRCLTVRIVGDGVAVGVAATAAATTTTTTTTTFAWEGGIIGMTFTSRRRTDAILCEIGDGGGIEHFRLGRCGGRRGSDQLARRDFFRLVGWRFRNLHRSRSSGGFTSSSRRARRSEVSGEHALQRLDEIVFAEPATILDLMFAGELSEVFDAESGEIRLIRHGSNSPAQTLRAARLSRRDEWPVAAFVVDPSWAWARR